MSLFLHLVVQKWHTSLLKGIRRENYTQWKSNWTFTVTQTENVEQSCTCKMQKWSETMQQPSAEVQTVIHHLIQLENEARKLCYIWFSNQNWQKFHYLAHSTTQAHLDAAYNRRNPRMTSLKQQGGVKIWLQYSHAGPLTGKQVKWWEKDFVCFSCICSKIRQHNVTSPKTNKILVRMTLRIFRQRETQRWITKLLVGKAKYCNNY